MTEKQPLSDRHIIECLSTYYSIAVVSLARLSLGADINASVYKVHARDNATYFVKIQRGHKHDSGIIMQQLLHDAGIQEVIAPLKARNNQVVQLFDGGALTVYPFIEGHDGFTQNLTRDQWVTLGKALGKIHEFKLPASLKTSIRCEAYSSQWRTVVRALDRHIENVQYHDDIATNFVCFFKKHQATIRHLVDRAEHLASKLKTMPLDLVVCHSDMHAGNVLLAHDGSLSIVDWDNPILAPRERDLMFIGGGVANVWNNAYEEELFYEGYGAIQINREALVYYRCERIVEDIAEYSEQLLSQHDHEQEYENRRTGYNHFVALFAPNGVVDIALRS